MRTKRFGILGAVLAGGLVLVGCGTSEPEAPPAAEETEPTGEWAEVVAAAEGEGQVLVYSVLVPAVNALIEEGFEDAHPDIDLEIIGLAGAEINPRVQAERSADIATADLVIGVDYQEMLNYAANGDLYDAIGPNATDERWQESGGLIDGKIQMTAVTGIVMAWNTELVSEPPADLLDVLDERFEGMVGMPDHSNQAVASFWAFLEGLDPDYWEKLNALSPKIYPHAVAQQEAVISGEIGVSIYTVPAVLQPMVEQGAPLDWAAPNPMWGPQTLAYMPNWNPTNPNAAQVLFDWLASDEGQQVVATNNVSVLDTPGTLQPFADTSIVEFDTQLDPEWQAESERRWNEAFGR